MRKPRINVRNPEAVGMCDRGAHVVSYRDLVKEMVVAGSGMQWNGLLVCPEHLDQPQFQDRPRRLGADPVPIKNPRPER